MDEQKEAKTGRGARFWVTVMLGGAVALLLLCVGLAVFGTWFADRQGEPGDPIAGVTDVEVRDNAFGPNSIEIAPDTTVTWTWVGKNDHNVYGDGLDSPIQTEGSYAYTFEETGTFDYECTLHPGMKGRVVVTEEVA